MKSNDIVIRNQYRKVANVKKYIVQYSSRENATQAIYPTYKEGYSKKTSDAEYSRLDGLAFDDRSLSLSRKDLLSKAEIIQKELDSAEENSCMKIIISFSSDYLIKHKIIDEVPKYRGYLFEKVDELKLRYAVKKSMNQYQKVLPVDSSWVGCLQFDTLHAHAHIVLTAGDKKYISKKEQDLIRDTLTLTLEGTKQYNPYYNRKKDMVLEKRFQKEQKHLVEIKDAVSLQRYISGSISIDNYIQELQYNHRKNITLISDDLRQKVVDNLNHYTFQKKNNISEKLIDIPRRLNKRVYQHLVRAYDYWRGIEAYGKQVEKYLIGKGKSPSKEGKSMKEFYQNELIYELKCVEKYRKFLPVSNYKSNDAEVLEKRDYVLRVAQENHDLISESIELQSKKSTRKLSYEEIKKLRKEGSFSEDMLDNQRIRKDMTSPTRIALFEYELMLRRRAKVGFIKRIFGSDAVKESFSPVTKDGFLKYPSRKKDTIDLDIDATELGIQPKNKEKWIENSKNRLKLYDKAKEYLDRTKQQDSLVDRCRDRMHKLRSALYMKLGINPTEKNNKTKEQYNKTTISLQQAKGVAKQHAEIVMKESDYDHGMEI
ncbi:hypothetical protein AALT52_01300 [Ligilactobacillus faecis]|uniref:Relaxase n=1 Tax=Ligilactobacillus faecis TaxID=762833 RepID=A0ABV4DM35_9LACO